MIGLLPSLSDNVPKSSCPIATKNINEVKINCVLSAEASKFDLIIVNEGVISVMPITEPALANAKMTIAKRFKDKV